MTDVNGLRIPGPRRGRMAIAKQTGRQDATRQYQAVVLTEPDYGDGTAVVDIAGQAKTAHIAPTAKAFQDGDRVTVEKRGGTWWIVETSKWIPPAQASAPPSGSAPYASDVGSTGLNDWNLDTLPNPSGSSNNQLYAHALRVVDRYNTMYYQVEDIKSSFNELEQRVRSAINNHASTTNDLGGLVEGTRDSMTGVYQGALQDRVVR